MIHIVLFQPENAGNVGNIIRSCYIHQATLHLIRPYGWIGNLRYFHKPLKDQPHEKLLRATMECLQKINIVEHNCWEDFIHYLSSDQNHQVMYFSIHNSTPLQQYLQDHPSIALTNNIYLVFGSETFGLQKLPADFVIQPRVLLEPVGIDKCYNLSNAVAISLYVCWQKLKN